MAGERHHPRRCRVRLIGLQITSVLANLDDPGQLILIGLAVTAATVLARVVWVFPATYLPRLLFRRIREHDPSPRWQTAAVISWSGDARRGDARGGVHHPGRRAVRDTVVFLRSS